MRRRTDLHILSGIFTSSRTRRARQKESCLPMAIAGVLNNSDNLLRNRIHPILTPHCKDVPEMSGLSMSLSQLVGPGSSYRSEVP